jgi:hypothetical protein
VTTKKSTIMDTVQRISHDNKIDGEWLILQKKFGGHSGSTARY